MLAVCKSVWLEVCGSLAGHFRFEWLHCRGFAVCFREFSIHGVTMGQLIEGRSCRRFAQGSFMETRELIRRLVALLDGGFGEEHPQQIDAAAARQPRRPDYEPSPEAIRSAILEIQAGWTDDDRLLRSGKLSQPISWVVPRVTFRRPIEQGD
jgi:hypothetical protein